MLGAYAPHRTILDHIVGYGRSRAFWISTYSILHAQQLRRGVRGRDYDLPQSPASSVGEIASSSREIAGDCGRLREIVISTPDTASEMLSVENEVCRYPKRPRSSIADDMVENSAMRRTRLTPPPLFVRDWGGVRRGGLGCHQELPNSL